MKQESLFTYVSGNAYPKEPGYQMRETSYAAAKKVKPTAKTLRDSVHNILKSKAMTADEVAAVMRESVLSIRPRVTELMRQGLIEDSGVRRENESGKKATVWRVK